MNSEVVQDQDQDTIGLVAVGRLKFLPTGQMVANRNVKEAMVKIDASNFQNADAHLPKAEFRMKHISKDMTPNLCVREMANKEQLQRT